MWGANAPSKKKHTKKPNRNSVESDSSPHYILVTCYRHILFGFSSQQTVSGEE